MHQYTDSEVKRSHPVMLSLMGSTQQHYVIIWIGAEIFKMSGSLKLDDHLIG